MMNYGSPAMPGMVQNQQPAAQEYKGSWLTGQQLAQISKTQGKYDFSVSPEDILISQCNHRNLDGSLAIYPDSDGSDWVTCANCHTRFKMSDDPAEEVDEAIEKVRNYFEQSKVMNTCLPPSVGLEYYKFLPFLKQFPKMYRMSVDAFKRQERIGRYSPTDQMNTWNVFAMLNNGTFRQTAGWPNPYFGGGMGMPPQQPNPDIYQQYAGYGQMNAPMPGMVNPQQQAMGYNPVYGVPMPGMVNPQQQTAGYQPQTTGYSLNPQGAAAQTMVNTHMPQQPSEKPLGAQLVQQPQKDDSKVNVAVPFTP